MIDASALGQKRRGRKPKTNKRVPLSLLLDPEIRRHLVDAAEENGRSITRQTELMLRDAALISPVNLNRIHSSNHYMTDKSEVYGRLVCPSAGETGASDKRARNRGNRTTEQAISIGERAGVFLEITYPGRSKDERIAHDLGISPGMAKLLRQGRAWTVGRLDQASALWPEFRGFIFAEPGSEQIVNRLRQLTAGLAQLADEVAQLRQELRSERARDWPGGDGAKHGTGVTKLKVGDCGGHQWHCEHDRIEE